MFTGLQFSGVDECPVSAYGKEMIMLIPLCLHLYFNFYNYSIHGLGCHNKLGSMIKFKVFNEHETTCSQQGSWLIKFLEEFIFASHVVLK